MAITYGSQAGTVITSFAMNETLGDQTQQSGNNTVVVSDDLSTAGNGQIGTGTNGLGNTYVGRPVIIDLGLSTEQERICIAEVAGTGNTFILTVHEDWDTNPVITTDTIHVPYEPGDIEDGGAGGGINLNAKTGLWELSNTLTIDGGFFVPPGQALECDDDGANVSAIVGSGGYLYMGYLGGGSALNGAISTAYNGATGEPWWQFQSGSFARIYDSLFWAQLVGQQFECASGSAVLFNKTKIISGADECHLFDADCTDLSISGKGATTDIVRVDAGTIAFGLIISDIYTLDTVADTTTETLELEGVVFSNIPLYITVRQGKTWNLIDPVWGATDETDFTWVSRSSNAVYDRRSVKATVQTADGTKLQNANVIVYEGTQLDDLVLELVTDTDGYAEDSFIYIGHVGVSTVSVTTTYGAHALRVDNWLYTPFVAAQVSAEKFSGVVTLIPDPNIVQTTQATAKSAGSGIVWNDDTNPSSIIEFTGGAGGTIGLAVGDTITGATSGADGIVTEILDGDGTAGTIHLKTRDANDFTNGETIGNGADGWTATYTASTQQDFSIWVDGNSLSYQTIHDYFAALTAENTLTTDGELIHEWGRDSQGRALYKSGSDFFTERSNSKGVIIVNKGAGNISYFTDDAGGTWTPPTTVTVQVTVLDNSTGLPIESAHVLLIDDATKSIDILRAATNASGLASTSYSGTVPLAVTGWVRQNDIVGTDYVPQDISGTVTAAGLSLTVRLNPL